jgi:hypothetical protein
MRWLATERPFPIGCHEAGHLSEDPLAQPVQLAFLELDSIFGTFP